MSLKVIMDDYSKAYEEYKQRRAEYYSERTELSRKDFDQLKWAWDSEYKQLWIDLNKYMDEQGLVLEFSACPQWKRITELEREMCV